MDRSTSAAKRPDHTRQARVFRVLNPLVRLLLSLHLRRMEERLLLLSFTGRRTGRTRTIPVSYVETRDGSLLAPGGGTWKWNLVDGRPVRIRLRGEDRLAVPELIRGQEEIARLLPEMVAANPRAEQFVGVPIGPDGSADRVRLAQAMSDGFLLVRLRLA